jgi:hypothetical protein
LEISKEAMMYQPGITQIASLLLVAGFAGAAAAGEARMIPSTSGTIQSIDPQSRVVVLENGNRFTVSEGTDFSSLRRGSEIVVIGGEDNSDRIVVNVQGRDSRATLVTDVSVPRVGTTMNSDRVVVVNSEPMGSNRAFVSSVVAPSRSVVIVATEQSPVNSTVTPSTVTLSTVTLSTVTLAPSAQASSGNVVRTTAVSLINSAPPRGNIVNPSNNVVRRSALALINRAPPRSSNVGVASPGNAGAVVSEPSVSSGGP